MEDETLTSLVVILAMSLLSPVLGYFLNRWVRIPLVVFEIALGIVVGPSVLDWASENGLVTFISTMGVATLLFIAGTEIDLKKIEGKPLNHALVGWFASLGLGLGAGLALTPLDGAQSGLVVGLALTTTSLGTLLPILRDAGELSRPFGTHVMAGSSIGEFGPIVAVALLLTTDNPLRTTLLLLAFIVVAVVTAFVASRPRRPVVARLLESTLDTSGQLAIRIVVLVMVAMVWLAENLDLDILLGAFTGGVVFRLFAASAPAREAEIVESKMNGLGFGFVIPFFFVVTGMRFDLGALGEPTVLARIPLFLALFLFVRGVPTLPVYRKLLGLRDRLALGFFLATQLPLVVVITTIGTDTNVLDTNSATALVGAAMLSVLVYPLVGATLRNASAPLTPDDVANL